MADSSNLVLRGGRGPARQRRRAMRRLAAGALLIATVLRPGAGQAADPPRDPWTDPDWQVETVELESAVPDGGPAQPAGASEPVCGGSDAVALTIERNARGH